MYAPEQERDTLTTESKVITLLNEQVSFDDLKVARGLVFIIGKTASKCHCSF